MTVRRRPEEEVPRRPPRSPCCAAPLTLTLDGWACHACRALADRGSVPPAGPRDDLGNASFAKEAAVLELLRHGMRPVPNWNPLRDGRCACGRPECESPGKHPRVEWAKYQRRAPTEAEVLGWLKRFPEANWGVVLGEDPGLIAADLDGPEAEHLLQERGIELPVSATALSHRGAKVFLKHPGGRLARRIALLKRGASQVDLLADGSQVVVPPSRHWTGSDYTWAVGLEAGIAAPPPALLELGRTAAKKNGDGRARGRQTGDGRIREGERNSALTSLAGTMRRRDMSEASIAAALHQENARRCDPPLPEAEVRAIAASVSRYAPSPPRETGERRLTDLGNARRLVARHREDLRYCYPWVRWVVWDGRRWRADETGEAVRRAKETVGSMYLEAAAQPGQDLRAALAAHAMKCESDSRIRAMLSLAESEPGVPVEPGAFDADPWLFNCLSGTLDLRTGELRPHRREDLLTKLAPVDYDPGAKAPTWTAFLDHIMAGNREVIEYLQRAVGHALTGDIREQVLQFLHGTGANGKTTFLNAILDAVGDYGKQAAPELLTIKYGTEHPTGLADLRGCRFVASIEVEEGKRLAEVLVKQLTGGDRLKARFMRENFFEFTPTHKIFLAVNHRPVVRGTDHAIWRRIKLIPFTVTIPEREQDKTLPEKLRAELPGILRWGVEGCLLWQREGLRAPAEVLAATEVYRAESDVAGRFLEERCTVDPKVMVTAGDLYAAYTKWCEENGERPTSQTDLGRRLAERGFTPGREGGGGRKSWHGVGLNP